MNSSEAGSVSPITAEGLAQLKAEIEQLEGAGRAEIAARIKTARELGDLKENADYHIAKEDQAFLETRIKGLRNRLQTAEVVEVDAEAEVFAFGRTAEVLDEDSGKTHIWTLVGPTEADQKQGRLSVESPVGRQLRDAPIGKSVQIETPGGTRRYVPSKLIEDG